MHFYEHFIFECVFMYKLFHLIFTKFYIQTNKYFKVFIKYDKI